MVGPRRDGGDDDGLNGYGGDERWDGRDDNGRDGREEEEEVEEPEPEERGLDAGGAERAETTAVAYGEV